MSETRSLNSYSHGQLVSVSMPGLSTGLCYGIIVRSYDPVVYQHGCADVWIDGTCHNVLHSYLLHVDAIPEGRPGLDPSHR